MKKRGLLFVNLGSPTAPTIPAVKSYLKEFLSDRNVIEMPAVLWQPLLRGIILPFHTRQSALSYHNCWLREGSPLLVYTKRLTSKVQALLPNWEVRYAMTYGQPAIEKTIAEMKDNCQQLTVIPLFPHYTKSTTKTIIEKVRAVEPQAKIIDRFADEDGYLNLLSHHIQSAWDKDHYDQLLISYHGIPQAMVKHGDPYQVETMRTTNKLIKRLSIPAEKIQMAYQSRFGPMPWLQPYLRDTLLSEAKRGHRKILLVVPSFIADCVETLVEDKIQNAQFFREHGGTKLTVIPALNDSPKLAAFFAQLASLP